VRATTTPDTRQHDSLIQVAARALAGMGVREPGAALLEPLAYALVSLDTSASSGKRIGTDPADNSAQAPRRSD
jgi:hypothetical protein